MKTKPWQELQFIKQIVIKPEDAKNPMWVDFVDDIEYTDIEYSNRRMVLNRDRAIKLGANTMYTVEMDYPDLFKRLVVATGDCEEAYRIYQSLKKNTPDNWADHDLGSVW